MIRHHALVQETTGDRPPVTYRRLEEGGRPVEKASQLLRSGDGHEGIDPASIEINNRLFFRFFQAANTLQGMGALTLGISNQQWAVLGALSRPQVAAAGMSVGALSRYLLVSRQNLSGVLVRLERDGYTQRVAGTEDRRSRKVRLTPRGEELWAGLAEPIGVFYEHALAGLSFDDRLTLLHYISILQTNMAKGVAQQDAGGRQRGR